MGKAGLARERRDAKRASKNKKKFANKNSLGKMKKKVGSAGRYMTRTMAVSKLQVPLKDFRKLCILKGIYPREPKKKFKGGNTTYYFAKDVLFLMHEPLLAKFREQKAFLKKVRKAAGRHERLQAQRLDDRRPVYKLDHLIRERYPSFADALQDLDDTLCLVFLFASLAPSKFVHAARVSACARLRREFLAYVARTHSLRHVFISIKGIYYQADVHGVSLTWVEPHHSFAQQPTMSVDYRVMLSFLELYEALLTFVNFKLYHDLGAAYPPDIDVSADDAGAHLGATVLRRPPLAVAALPLAHHLAQAEAAAPSSVALGALEAPRALEAPSGSQLISLRAKLSRVDNDGVAGVDGGVKPGVKNDGGVGTGVVTTALKSAAAVDAWSGDVPLLGATVADAQALSPEAMTLRTLFSACYFFCGCETPVPSLEFVILSCGGHVGWQGEASPFGEDDARVTHQVIDRPSVPARAIAEKSVGVQPQWVYDCVNARQLLPTHAYRPGATCPPHLSPFIDGSDGYAPHERVRQAAQEEHNDESELDEAQMGQEEAGQNAIVRHGDEAEEVEEAGHEQNSAELAGEMHGDHRLAAFVTKSTAPVGREEARAIDRNGEVTLTGALDADEERRLAIIMMSKKKRKLYERMQYGIQKKAAAASRLRTKRAALDAEAEQRATR